jgi:hypothetical protein
MTKLRSFLIIAGLPYERKGVSYQCKVPVSNTKSHLGLAMDVSHLPVPPMVQHLDYLTSILMVSLNKNVHEEITCWALRFSVHPCLLPNPSAHIQWACHCIIIAQAKCKLFEGNMNG